jgi:hypothetical protein
MWDADAIDSARLEAQRLSTLFDVRLVCLHRGDPGDFTRHQLSWYRENAQPISGETRL